MAIRVARGYDAVHHPYQELYEGVRPSIQGLRAASFLPVAFLDKIHDDDPVVMLPGTFVGVLNTGQLTGGSGDTLQADSLTRIVPASPNDYTLAYTQFDIDFGTPDIDSSTLADVTAAGTSTTAIGDLTPGLGIRPIGIITAPVYSSALTTKFTNYTRDLTPSVLTGPYTAVIPAVTVNEKLIEAGDIVCLDNGQAAGSWDPANLGTATTDVVGRIMTLPRHTTTNSGELQHHVVGRCINKWVVARNAVAGTNETLAVGLTSGDTFTLTDTRHQYATLKKVQTVPGLGLSGSGTLGIPAIFKHARADSNGHFYALEIRIDL